jgi:hypothetical protein
MPQFYYYTLLFRLSTLSTLTRFSATSTISLTPYSSFSSTYSLLNYVLLPINNPSFLFQLCLNLYNLNYISNLYFLNYISNLYSFNYSSNIYSLNSTYSFNSFFSLLCPSLCGFFFLLSQLSTVSFFNLSTLLFPSTLLTVPLLYTFIYLSSALYVYVLNTLSSLFSQFFFSQN